MPEPRTVWLVEPPRNVDGVEGTLMLEHDPARLVFAAREPAGSLTIPFDRLQGVRRIRGTPILEVRHRARGIDQEVFLYFTSPPPVPGRPQPTLPGSTGRARRRERRKALTWLWKRNATLKGVVQAWADAIEGSRRPGGA
ncbi:MAG TPA: hypothetical protein VEO00_11730 [Actinomycetota bacterium]|nr:hypothetical protein [Actinomycetota bacterium]